MATQKNKIKPREKSGWIASWRDEQLTQADLRKKEKQATTAETPADMMKLWRLSFLCISVDSRQLCTQCFDDFGCVVQGFLQKPFDAIIGCRSVFICLCQTRLARTAS